MVPATILCGTSRNRGVTVRVQKIGSRRVRGLGSSEIDAVMRYEARGRLPRAPLRFWIDGEGVEVSPPESESVVEAAGVQAVSSTAPPVPLSVELAQEPDPPQVELPQEPDPPVAAIEVVAASDVSPQPELPIYRWVTASVGQVGNVPRLAAVAPARVSTRHKRRAGRARSRVPRVVARRLGARALTPGATGPRG